MSSGARTCVGVHVAGDPRQLPPTLSGAEGSEASNDLGKTLFTRLANTGVQPVLLKRQYRCHPHLGTLASDLFYESKLVNGVTEEERRPVVKGWPALVFFDSAVSREQQQGSSFSNSHEARFIVHLVSKLLDNGLQASDIGVICLYKAQETTVRDALQGAADAAGKRVDGHGGFGVQVAPSLRPVLSLRSFARFFSRRFVAISSTSVSTLPCARALNVAIRLLAMWRVSQGGVSPFQKPLSRFPPLMPSKGARKKSFLFRAAALLRSGSLPPRTGTPPQFLPHPLSDTHVSAFRACLPNPR